MYKYQLLIILSIIFLSCSNAESQGNKDKNSERKSKKSLKYKIERLKPTKHCIFLEDNVPFYKEPSLEAKKKIITNQWRPKKYGYISMYYTVRNDGLVWYSNNEKDWVLSSDLAEIAARWQDFFGKDVKIYREPDPKSRLLDEIKGYEIFKIIKTKNISGKRWGLIKSWNTPFDPNGDLPDGRTVPLKEHPSGWIILNKGLKKLPPKNAKKLLKNYKGLFWELTNSEYNRIKKKEIKDMQKFLKYKQYIYLNPSAFAREIPAVEGGYSIESAYLIDLKKSGNKFTVKLFGIDKRVFYIIRLVIKKNVILYRGKKYYKIDYKYKD